MQKLASIVPKIIEDRFNTISMNILIKRNWEKILTPQLTRFVKFNSALVKIIKGKVELRITINVLSSAIFLAKIQNNAIISSIRLLTGIETVKTSYRQVLNFNDTSCRTEKTEKVGF